MPNDTAHPVSRVHGLDALRFVCALFVVIGHYGGPPLVSGLDRSTSVGYWVGGASHNLWNGPAAVIAFFVISGFCIHYPFARTQRIPSLAAFMVRRVLRIGLPLAAAVTLAPLVGVQLNLLNDSILWSLIAELVYYLLYPALLAVRRGGCTWTHMWAGAFVAAVAVALTRPDAGNYPSFGVSLNWVLGLPCWLAGCELAERAVQDGLPNRQWTWTWRLSVWALASATSILRYHTPLGYPWTLNVFAVVVVVWIAGEIGRYRTRMPLRGIEWAGGWSYSLYLAHLPAQAAFRHMEWPAMAPMLQWSLQLAFALTSSYAFYLAVERPGHRLARALAVASQSRVSNNARLQTDTSELVARSR